MFSLLFLQYVEMIWCEIKSVSFCVSVLALASSCHFFPGQSLYYNKSMAVVLQLEEMKYRLTSVLHFWKTSSWPYEGDHKETLASASARHFTWEDQLHTSFPIFYGCY